MKHKLKSRLLGEISVTSDIHLYGIMQRETEERLDENEREWKSWLEIQESKTKLMASGPFTSLQIDGETMETVTDFISWGSKIAADGDCSHEIKTHWKDWCWSWSFNTLATWCKELTHWKRPWFWEGLKAGGGGDDRGWGGWMASLTPWTWVTANTRSWWWTGKPGLLQSMGWQRVRHHCMTELNWNIPKEEIDKKAGK